MISDHRARRRPFAQTAVTHISDALGLASFRYAGEAELQRGLANVLDEAARRAPTGHPMAVSREERLTDGRIDFLVTTPHAFVGIEVKVASSSETVERQLRRYAPDVDWLILVTTRSSHRSLEGLIDETPLTVEWIGGLR